LSVPTVFILGAGASASYSYPAGQALVDQICQGSLGGGTVLDCPEYWRFHKLLAQSPDESVDAFLEHQPDPQIKEIGKRAIAEWLIRRENLGGLVRGSTDDDWVRYLVARVFGPLRFDAIHTVPIAFITFNYDRSLEVLLVHSLSAKYDRPIEETAARLASIPIIHVHGDLGPLPWQKRSGVVSRDYSPEVNDEKVTIAASQIKIVHEASVTSKEFMDARALLASAARIYFLGFGYLTENLQRLCVHWGTLGPLQVHGSCYRLSEARIRVLRSKYNGLNLGYPTHRVTQFLDNCDTFLQDVS